MLLHENLDYIWSSTDYGTGDALDDRVDDITFFAAPTGDVARPARPAAGVCTAAVRRCMPGLLPAGA